MRDLDFTRHHFGNQRGAVLFLQFDNALGFSDFGIDAGDFGFDVVNDGGLFFLWMEYRNVQYLLTVFHLELCLISYT